MEKLKPCPCGKTPETLLLVDNGSEWAYACGSCCNEWHIEFRTFYKELDSNECMALAVEAWNLANRNMPNKSVRVDLTDSVCYNDNHESKDGFCVVDGGIKPENERFKK